MILPTSEITAMAPAAKADLVAKSVPQLKKMRLETAIALASLQRANEYAGLGFKSAGHLASAKGHEYRDWSLMLAIGRRALDYPEIDQAFRDGRLNWSKVRALLPVLQRENVKEWIDVAARMTSNQLERRVSEYRDPSVGGPMHRMLLPDPIFRQFEQMANGIRRLLGEKRWSDAECVSQLLGELQARRKADFLRASGAAAPVAGGSMVPVDGDGRSRTIPAEIRRAALVRARFVCEFCKNRYGAEIHHVIPFCKGGTHELHNLIVLCHRCHRKLHDEQRRDAATRAGAGAHDGCDGEPGSGAAEPGDHGDHGPGGNDPVPEEDPVSAGERAGERVTVGEHPAPVPTPGRGDPPAPENVLGHPSRDGHELARRPPVDTEAGAADSSAVRGLHARLSAAEDLPAREDLLQPPGGSVPLGELPGNARARGDSVAGRSMRRLPHGSSRGGHT
jgi:hypothetical protein